MSCRNKSNNITVELYGSTFVNHIGNGGRMGGSYCKFLFVFIPRVSFSLLMAQTQLTPFHIQLKNNNFQFVSNIGKFAWVLYFLRPGKVRYIYQPVNSFFQFYKNTKVCEVSDNSRMS